MENIEETRKKVRQFLNERDWPLEIGAKHFKCSIGTLSNFLNGKTNPHSRTLYKIEKALEGNGSNE